MNRVYPTSVPAFGTVALGVVGSGFKVIEIGGAGLIAKYSGEKGSFDIPLSIGRDFHAGFLFEKLELENTTGSPIPLSIFVGKGKIEDDSLVGEVKAVSAGTAINALGDQTIGAAATYTIPANVNRKELHIYCDQAVKYGTGAGAGAGIPIPKETIAILDIESPLSLFNLGAVTANLSIVEVLK